MVGITLKNNVETHWIRFRKEIRRRFFPRTRRKKRTSRWKGAENGEVKGPQLDRQHLSFQSGAQCWQPKLILTGALGVNVILPHRQYFTSYLFIFLSFKSHCTKRSYNRICALCFTHIVCILIPSHGSKMSIHWQNNSVQSVNECKLSPWD